MIHALRRFSLLYLHLFHATVTHAIEIVGSDDAESRRRCAMAWYLRFILSIHVAESLVHLRNYTMYVPQSEQARGAF